MLLRSGEDPIDLLDPEACEMETSSIRRLSRMMFEDIITAEVGTKFKLYVSKSAYENEYGWWRDKLRYAIDILKVEPCTVWMLLLYFVSPGLIYDSTRCWGIICSSCSFTS